jgi:putative sigma-54 modulation protein
MAVESRLVVEYTGRQTEVPPAVRGLVEKKLRRLSRVLPVTRAHVILTADRHDRRIAEVSIHSRHLDLTATEEATDFESAVSNVIEKLLRQAQRHVGRRRERKRRAPARSTALWEGVVAREQPAHDDGGPRVIRTQRFVIKPMTVEEAALEVDRSADGVLVFREARTERVNVLFRRRDGNLGLIEPEA